MSCEIPPRRSKARALMQQSSDMFPKCPVITTTELILLMDGSAESADNVIRKSLILVDIRSQEERDVSMIPGAITVEDFEALVKTNPEVVKSRLIVPYCTIGYRSGKWGTHLVEQHGFTNVRNGEGIVLWTYESSNLVSKKGDVIEPSMTVHTFGSSWDLAADGFSTIQFGIAKYAFYGALSLLRSSP